MKSDGKGPRKLLNDLHAMEEVSNGEKVIAFYIFKKKIPLWDFLFENKKENSLVKAPSC